MTDEMKKDLETVIGMCPKTKRMYVSGDFSNLSTEPTILLVLSESDKGESGEYTYILCQWLLPKYNADDSYPTLGVYVMNESTSKDLECLYAENELAYNNGEWLV